MIGNAVLLAVLGAGSLSSRSEFIECVLTPASCTNLSLAELELTGRLPTTLGMLTSLTYLGLEQNALSGTLPTELASLTALEHLAVERNVLSGSLPTELASLTALIHLELFRNRLAGTLPSSVIGALTALTHFDVGGNRLAGPLPSFEKLTALQAFSIAYNRVTGTLPTSLNLTALRILWVHRNNIYGTLPELSRLSQLRSLQLGYNRLHGSIPRDYAMLHGLTFLQLARNRLAGTIPAELTSLSRLRSIDLSDNALRGYLPRQLGSLTALTYLAVDRNFLSGRVPESLGSLTGLRRCRLTHDSSMGFGVTNVFTLPFTPSVKEKCILYAAHAWFGVFVMACAVTIFVAALWVNREPIYWYAKSRGSAFASKVHPERIEAGIPTLDPVGRPPCSGHSGQVQSWTRRRADGISMRRFGTANERKFFEYDVNLERDDIPLSSFGLDATCDGCGKAVTLDESVHTCLSCMHEYMHSLHFCASCHDSHVSPPQELLGVHDCSSPNLVPLHRHVLEGCGLFLDPLERKGVINILSDSPAARCNVLKVGDVLVAVDGVQLTSIFGAAQLVDTIIDPVLRAHSLTFCFSRSASSPPDPRELFAREVEFSSLFAPPRELLPLENAAVKDNYPLPACKPLIAVRVHAALAALDCYGRRPEELDSGTQRQSGVHRELISEGTKFAMLSYKSDLKESAEGRADLMDVLLLLLDEGVEWLWWDWLVVDVNEEEGRPYVQHEFEDAMKWAHDHAFLVAIVWPRKRDAIAYLARPWCVAELVAACSRGVDVVYVREPDHMFCEEGALEKGRAWMFKLCGLVYISLVYAAEIVCILSFTRVADSIPDDTESGSDLPVTDQGNSPRIFPAAALVLACLGSFIFFGNVVLWNSRILQAIGLNSAPPLTFPADALKDIRSHAWQSKSAASARLENAGHLSADMYDLGDAPVCGKILGVHPVEFTFDQALMKLARAKSMQLDEASLCNFYDVTLKSGAQSASRSINGAAASWYNGVPGVHAWSKVRALSGSHASPITLCSSAVHSWGTAKLGGFALPFPSTVVLHKVLCDGKRLAWVRLVGGALAVAWAAICQITAAFNPRAKVACWAVWIAVHVPMAVVPTFMLATGKWTLVGNSSIFVRGRFILEEHYTMGLLTAAHLVIGGPALLYLVDLWSMSASSASTFNNIDLAEITFAICLSGPIIIAMFCAFLKVACNLLAIPCRRLSWSRPPRAALAVLNAYLEQIIVCAMTAPLCGLYQVVHAKLSRRIC